MKKIFLSALIVLPIFSSLIRSGYFPMQDKMQHFRIYEMGKCFLDGQFPCRWVPDLGYGYGYPLFNFYAPGPFYLGYLIHLIGFQYIDVVKNLFILGNLFSVLAMFVLIKDLFKSNLSAVLSSTLYAFAPIRSAQIYVRGSLSENLAFIFFPLIFFTIHRSLKNQSFGGICLSLSVAALCLTHNLMSLLFLPVIFIWLLSLAYIYKTSFHQILTTGIKIILGLGLASFFLLPAYLEKNFVHTETLIGGYFGYLQHFVTLSQLFISNNFGYGSSQLGPNDDLTLSLGHVHWLGTLIVIVGLIISRKKTSWRLPLISLSLLSLVFIFLMHARSTPIWEFITPLQFLQFPWRLLVLTSFFMSVIAGYLPLLVPSRYLVAILLTLVISLHGHFFLPNSWLSTSDDQLFSGQNYQDQLTVSIFDYLPISAVKPPNIPGPEIPEILFGDVKINQYLKFSNHQKGDIEVDSSTATIRLPLYDFPGMQIKIDNQIVGHYVNCSSQPYCFGLVTVDMPSGKHEISATLTNTPIRQISNYISLTSLGIILCLSLKKFFFA